jgi:hypothetical protein
MMNTWGKHYAQGASTGTRTQASWVVGTNCIAGESSRERAPLEGHKKKKNHTETSLPHTNVLVL